MGKLAVRRLVYVLVACRCLMGASTPPLVCASGGAVATVDLEVVSPSLKSGSHPLPMRTINRLEEGDTIRYRPVLRPHEERKGEVTLVLVPANKRVAERTQLLVFPPQLAGKQQQWTVPWRTSLAAFVYGPSGLNVKRVEAFLDRDDELIGQLADYADKTAKAEALIAALSAPDNSQEALGAALDGFSSKFGGSVQIARTASLNQQATAAFRTLDPSMASYDPLAGQGTQPVGQTAGLATSVAEMFYGSPVGLAAGGTAMLMSLEAMAFPKSEFRSAFSQPMANDALGLCGKVGAAPVHTRIAYLWAVRVPNVVAPRLTVGKASSLPGMTKSPLPLTGSEAEWKYLDRARNWTLQPDRGKAIPIKVAVLANTKSIELDPGKDVKPGRYSLIANWDWDQFQVNGFFEVRPLADFKLAKLTPESQDRLVEGTGKVPLTLEGADFEFVTKVEMKKLNDEFASASAVPFVLKQPIRTGVENQMDIQVSTSGLENGLYQLMVSQVDGKSHDVALKVLPAIPSIDNLPVTVNQGVSSVGFELRGKRLDLLRRLDVSGAVVMLGTASADGAEREINLRFPSTLKPGTTLPGVARVADRSRSVGIAEAVRVVGPRPAITDVTLSELPAQTVRLDIGELPGGLVLSAMIRVANLPSGSDLRLECEGMASAAVTLHPGEQSGGARLEQLTADQLFLTFDTGAWNNGCDVQASIHSGVGDSAPRRIARIVDLPAIDQFTLGAEEAGGAVSATLVGKNLETIDKAGWSAALESSVSELPQPLSDDGRQKLQVKLTQPPAPDAVLYLRLRGDSKTRVTTVHAN